MHDQRGERNPSPIAKEPFEQAVRAGEARAGGLHMVEIAQGAEEGPNGEKCGELQWGPRPCHLLPGKHSA